MVKILLDKYPKGSYKGQKSDGRYMDGLLYKNLDLLATRIVDDMTFMGIIYSSTLEVGTGKSVLATQIGEAWTDLMNKKYNKNLTFTARNLVFNPKDLIDRSFELPKGSCIILDEWEDATYWSQLGITLRQFFRKCRQLNLFMICIIPNWFQLPLSYAVSRSIFAIDVRFGDNFERGFFKFYDFGRKRDLYIRGKKEHNYHCAPCTFPGRFLDGYGLPEAEYRAAKLKDMMEYDRQAKKAPTEKEIIRRTIRKLYAKKPLKTQKDFGDALGVCEDTINNWINDKRDDNDDTPEETEGKNRAYTMQPNSKEVVWDEDKLTEEQEKNEEGQTNQ